MFVYEKSYIFFVQGSFRMFVNEKSYNIFVQGSLTWRTVNINALWTQLEGESLNLTKKKRPNFLYHFVCLNIL